MKQIHIGKIIQTFIIEKGINKSDLARRINTTPQNVYGILKRKSIDTELLQEISSALEFNFFQYFVPPVHTTPAPGAAELEAMKKEIAYLKEINSLLKQKK